MSWIKISDQKPPSNTSVLIRQKTGYKENSVTVIGKYLEKYQEEAGDCDCWEFCDYHEEQDEYFYPEGWYENQWNWDDYASIHINEEITHWMPLPAPPCLCPECCSSDIDLTWLTPTNAPEYQGGVCNDCGEVWNECAR